MPVPHTLPATVAYDAHSGNLTCLVNWGFLAANPPVFASLIAVVGTLAVGALTLLGVWLTLRFNRKKMAADLIAAEGAAAASRAFSAKQATDAHLMEMRKVLYATLIEEHQDAVAALFAMSNLSLLEASDTAKKLFPYTSAVQKTMIISGAKTSKVAREVHSKVMEAIFDVLPYVVALVPYKEKLKKANEDLNERIAAMRAVVERAKLIPKADVDGNRDIGNNALAAQAEYEAAKKTRDQLALDSDKSFAEFQAAATRHTQEFSLLQSEFLSLARAELVIVDDPIEPHEVAKNIERAQTALQKLKKALGMPTRRWLLSGDETGIAEDCNGSDTAAGGRTRRSSNGPDRCHLPVHRQSSAVAGRLLWPGAETKSGKM